MKALRTAVIGAALGLGLAATPAFRGPHDTDNVVLIKGPRIPVDPPETKAFATKKRFKIPTQTPKKTGRKSKSQKLARRKNRA